MKKLLVELAWAPGRVQRVGTIADAGRRIYFEYDPDFVRGGLQISPFKLPLRAGLIEHTDRAFGPLPGVIDDSLPDGWGLLLMDRALRQGGLDPAAASPLDRLAWLGTRTMGALQYQPATDERPDERLLDLHALGRNAAAILRGEAVAVLPELMRAGGSPAGARPKVLVGLRGEEVISGADDLPEGFEHWIVKFPARPDGRDAGAAEQAYSQMARAAGIAMPPTQLIRVTPSQAYFAARRFDRAPGNRRLHVHSFGNLVHANFRVPTLDYADLLRVTRALTRNHEDLLQVFRRMVFNVAAHNQDDHAKNFAFVMSEQGEWSLSPAYDVSFSTGPGGEQTMAVAGEGRQPGREQVLQIARQFDIRASIAEQTIADVNKAIGRWATFAGQAGCTKKTTRLVAAALRRL